MLRRLDRSSFLLRSLQAISNYFAKRRGLLVLWGIFLVFLGFVFELLGFFVASDVLRLLEIVFRNVGILMALIGLLLVRPLGAS